MEMGGYGSAPILVIDGKDGIGVEKAAASAYSHAIDEWASSEYRMELARILTIRCLQEVKENETDNKGGS